MPHSLRAKLSGLRYKGILEDKDYKRLCHALDLEKAEQEPADKSNLEKICEELAAENDNLIGAYKQVCKERDIAIEQLHELGYELGQKIEPCDDAISLTKEAYSDLCLRASKSDDLQRALDMEKGAYNALVKNIQCDDVVSRQAVLDLAEKGILVSNGNYKSVCKAINELPSVRPQEQTGKWKFVCQHWRKCSECGFSHKFAEDWNYCPNCGAKMVEQQESEDK